MGGLCTLIGQTGKTMDVTVRIEIVRTKFKIGTPEYENEVLEDTRQILVCLCMCVYTD